MSMLTEIDGVNPPKNNQKLSSLSQIKFIGDILGNSKVFEGLRWPDEIRIVLPAINRCYEQEEERHQATCRQR